MRTAAIGMPLRQHLQRSLNQFRLQRPDTTLALRRLDCERGNTSNGEASLE